MPDEIKMRWWETAIMLIIFYPILFVGSILMAMFLWFTEKTGIEKWYLERRKE